jgi:hypothetical protein
MGLLSTVSSVTLAGEMVLLVAAQDHSGEECNSDIFDGLSISRPLMSLTICVRWWQCYR